MLCLVIRRFGEVGLERNGSGMYFYSWGGSVLRTVGFGIVYLYRECRVIWGYCY